MGFRYYMDVIPLKPELVKGSHGTLAANPEKAALCISEVKALRTVTSTLPMTGVKDLIVAHVLSNG